MVNDLIFTGYSNVPLKITMRLSLALFLVFCFFDFLFFVAYLASTLPEFRALTVSNSLAILDLDVEANIPTNYSILKLYFTALCSFLMVFCYENKAPIFWKLAAFVTFFIGLDESAQLHEVWAAGVAPLIFGTDFMHGNQFSIIPYALMLGSFYLFSLSLFPRESPIPFMLFVASGFLFILSQAAEWSFDPAMAVMHSGLGLVFGESGRFGEATLLIAWEEGLEMLGYSCLSGGILYGVAVVQSGNISRN